MIPNRLARLVTFLLGRNSPADRCGPQGEYKARFVPDKIFQVPLRPACEQHDIDYATGKSEIERKTADRKFFWFIIDLFQSHRRYPFSHLYGLPVAWVYYRAVRLGGHAAFWKGKDPNFLP
jgi:hypothetical protein|tara:strand:+ start:7216 stop:7578 length:363 start_codon:yes stop_codon:yes gene_type:complete